MANNKSKSTQKLTAAQIATKYGEGLLKANPDLTCKSEGKLLKKISRGDVNVLTPSQEAKGITVWLKDQTKAVATYVDKDGHEICEVNLTDLFVGRQITMVVGQAALSGVQIGGKPVSQNQPNQIAGQAAGIGQLAMGRAVKNAQAQAKTFGRSQTVQGSAAATAAAQNQATQNVADNDFSILDKDELKWIFATQMAKMNPKACMDCSAETFRSVQFPKVTADGSKWTLVGSNERIMAWQFRNQKGMEIVISAMDLLAATAIMGRIKDAVADIVAPRS